MTMLGKTAWNKGIKMPHSPEWESRRIAAVREAAQKRIYPKGYKRPLSAIQPMRDGFAKDLKNNPEKYKNLAIKNLSRNGTDLKKENSPNWLGGKTHKSQVWRSQNGKLLYQWREAVYARDQKSCRNCQSKNKVQAHHIIPVSKFPCFAFLEMNGVCLCYECHKTTDSFAGKGHIKSINLGETLLVIQTIPHNWQAYPTVGNWNFGTNGELLVLVSDLHNPDYHFLIGMHEAIEAWLCRNRGISESSVTKFDCSKYGLKLDDPGSDKKAPYHKEHMFALKIEKMLSKEIGLDWDEYEKNIIKECQ